MLESTDCIVDIVPEGRFVTVQLPFDIKDKFGIAKGNIYANCTIHNVEFRTRILSRGNQNYFFYITKSIQKKLGFQGEPMQVSLQISPDILHADKLSTGREKADSLTNCPISVLEAIKDRQSVRKFKGEELSEVQINTILHAGFCAPSAHNKRPYHFIVVKDKEKRKRIAEASTYAKMLADADIGIIVCGDKLRQGTAELLIEDCAAAVQNMLLAIHGIGLGGVWCGVVKNADWYHFLIEEMQLPDKIIPVAVIAVGYSAELPRIRERFEEHKVHYEKW